MKLMKQTGPAVDLNAPGPPAGEGIAEGQPAFGWVRDSFADAEALKQPITRLRGVYHRAALRADPLAQPPSPAGEAGGEGKTLATRSSQSP
jgi:hypothetical protein